MEIRDNRQKEWFWLDNEYLNGYARHLGTVATAVYISLCRHADNKTQTCFPSMELIAEENGIGSRNTVSKAINALEEWNIIKIERNYNKSTKQRENNIYTLLAKSEWKPKPCTNNEHGVHAQKNQKPCTNNDESHAQNLSSNKTHINKTHINNTQLTIQAKQALQELPKEISEVIKEFETVNKACSDYYGNVTQRKAVEKLINAYGYEFVVNVIRMLPKMNRVLYNKATTPVELWNKWAKIEAEASKLKETKNSQKYAITKTY
jgi:DNA-binding transcriptional regulator GbsR (MarR family)